MAQLRFPGVDPPRPIHPDIKRSSPVFWVQRLRVLRELKPGEEHIIRDVELRRGLNIIWAPPHDPPDGNALFENGVAGHTAGKTTFCRLVRHVLGERGFATDETRRRIREKFPTGWVTATILIGDDSWLVARPFGIGPHAFCLRGNEIAHLTEAEERLDYQEFLDAVSAAAVSGLPASRFPATDEPMRREHVFPWLSRDQECRFADFLEWRHPSSDSESPALNVEERQFVLRAVLGLISDVERIEQQTNARLVARKEEAVQREPMLLHQSRTDHDRVATALGRTLAPASTPLFGSETRIELARLTAELLQRERQLADTDRRTELSTALERAVAAETNASRDLREAEARFEVEQGALAQLAGDAQSAVLAALPPGSEYCSVRLTVAREQGCPLAGARPIDLVSRRSERTAAEELQRQRQLVEGLSRVVENEKGKLADAENATRAARRKSLSANTAFDEQRGRIHQERARLSQIERLVHAAEEAAAQASELAESVASLSRDIKESYARQEQLRGEGREAIQRFSARFEYVVRALLGTEVTGRVDTSGRSLTLVVEEHGKRDSAAIATVRLLAFDLAALASSVEGYGSFPRFLIHDGPREADLSVDIYERLFLFAREIEKSFDAEPSFQYIVTTTTAPPTTLQGDPWLRLKLAGVPAQERLLRCDL